MSISIRNNQENENHLIDSEQSVITLSSVWANSVSESSHIAKIQLADAKYDKFYLKSIKKYETRKETKLARDLFRAEMISSKDAAFQIKKPKVDVDTLGVKFSPRSRLEM